MKDPWAALFTFLQDTSCMQMRNKPSSTSMPHLAYTKTPHHSSNALDNHSGRPLPLQFCFKIACPADLSHFISASTDCMEHAYRGEP